MSFVKKHIIPSRVIIFLWGICKHEAKPEVLRMSFHGNLGETYQDLFYERDFAEMQSWFNW